MTLHEFRIFQRIDLYSIALFPGRDSKLHQPCVEYRRVPYCHRGR